MADVVGFAEVEIRPNFVGFETQLKTGIDRAMTSVRASVDKAMRSVDESAKVSATRVGESFQKAGKTSNEALAKVGTNSFRTVTVEAEKASLSVSEKFASASTKAKGFLRDIGGGGSFGSVEEAARRAGKVISDSFVESGAKSSEATKVASEGQVASIESVGAAAASTATTTAAAAETTVASTASKLGSFGSTMTKSVTLPILGIAAASVIAFEQVDKGYHTLEQRTGATGATLDGLKKSFDEVASNTGAKFSVVSDVMSQLYSRLGLTGKALEDNTLQFLTLQRVAGTTAPTIDAVAKAMVAWKVSSADQSTELDHLFVASQKTGVPLNALVDDVTKFAPLMRAAGISIDQSTVLMANFEKAGIPAGKVILGITTYLGGIVKSGGDASGAFQKLVDKATGMYKVGDGAKATALLVQDLGKKSGLTVAQMIQDGRLSGKAFDGLGASIAGATGKIKETGVETTTMGVQLNKIKNQAILALAPIGAVLLPAILTGLKNIVTPIQAVVSGFSDMPHSVQIGVIAFLGLAAAIGPIVKIVSFLFSGFGLLWGAVVGGLEAIQTVTVALTGLEVSLGGIALAIAIPIAAFAALYWAMDSSGDHVTKVSDAVNTVAGLVVKNGDDMQHAFSSVVIAPFWAKLGDRFTGAGVSLADIRDHLGSTGAAWKTFSEDAAVAVNKSGGAGYVQTKRYLDDLRDAYEKAGPAAEKLRKGFLDSGLAADGSARKVSASAAVVTLSLHENAKAATGDMALIVKAMADTNYAAVLKKANSSVEAVVAEAKYTGTQLSDAFKMDPKVLAKSAEDLRKFASQIHDGIVSAGDPSNISSDILKYGQAGIADFYTKQIRKTDEFTANIQQAMKRGLNANTIQQLITAGPEKAGPVLKEILKGDGNAFIQQVNVFSAAIEHQATIAADQARIMRIAVASNSQKLVQESAKASQISALTSAGTKPMTAEQLRKAMGLPNTAEVEKIAKDFGLDLAPAVQRATNAATPKTASISNAYTKLTATTSRIVDLGVRDIAMKFGTAGTALTASQARLRDALILNWVKTHGGTVGQAQAMIAQLDGKLTVSATAQAAKALWIKNQYIARWAETNHVSVTTATTMFTSLEAKHSAHNTTMDAQARTLESNLLASALRTKFGTTKTFGDMTTDQQRLLRAGWAQTAIDSGIGGDRIGEALRSKLAAKASATSSTEAEFLKSLVESINPILQGVGQKEISVPAGGGRKFLAEGGFISGGKPGKDSVPAMLMPGEVVVRTSSVAKAGVQNLLDVNAGRTPPGWHIPGFAAGGAVLDAAAIKRTQDYGFAQAGKPYVWGAVGPNGFDCSGLASALVNTALGRPPNSRLFTSATLGGSGLSPGLGQIAVGGENSGGKGHVAATIGGINFEATPPILKAGPGARGADSSMFTLHVHLGSGDFVSGGGGGGGSFNVPMPKPPTFGTDWLGSTGSAAAKKAYDVAQAFSNLHTQQGGDPNSGGTGIGAPNFSGPASGDLLGRVMAAIRFHESHGNYTVHNPNGSAAGAYQVTSGTWGGYGGFPSASSAPPSIQDQFAALRMGPVLAANGNDPGAVAAYWYTGQASRMNDHSIPPGGNTQSVFDYAQYIRNLTAHIAAVTGYAAGGSVPGFGNSDSVPALLTPGEFVLSKSAAEAIGHSTLGKWNAYGAGGKVERPAWLDGVDLHPYAAHRDFYSGATLAAHKGSHSTLYTQYRPDERGFNWKTMGDLAATGEEAKFFPKGLLGDLNNDGKITDKEWKSWLGLRKILAGPKAADVDKFFAAITEAAALRRRYYTRGFNWKRTSDGLSPKGHVQPDVGRFFGNGLIGDLDHSGSISTSEWHSWLGMMKTLGGPIEASKFLASTAAAHAPKPKRPSYGKGHGPARTEWLTNDAFALLGLMHANATHGPASYYRDLLRYFGASSTGTSHFVGDMGASIFGYGAQKGGGYARKLPAFHGGGIFRTSEIGGEGLALLKDGERVKRSRDSAEEPSISVVFSAGAIQVNVTGKMTDADARRTGEAVGEGIANTLRKRRLLADAATS